MSTYALIELDHTWCISEWRSGFESPQVIARCPNFEIAKTVRDAMETSALLRDSAYKLRCAIELSNGDRHERL